jgi:hypothetical protein
VHNYVYNMKFKIHSESMLKDFRIIVLLFRSLFVGVDLKYRVLGNLKSCPRTYLVVEKK